MALKHAIRLLRHPLFLLRRQRWTRPLLAAVDFTLFRQPEGVGFPIAVRALRNHALFNSRLAELQTTEVIRRLALAKRPFCFVDVGANVGFFSWLVLTHNPAAKVIAIEPDRLNLQCLRRTAARYPQFEVRILDCAASAQAGTATFHADDLSSVTGTIVGSRETADVAMYHAPQRRLEVRTETLDALVGNQLPEVSCIKIDVEGAELDVLAGARRLLAEARPHLIIECMESKRAALLEILAAANYEITHDRLDPNGDVTNVVAAPR